MCQSVLTARRDQSPPWCRQTAARNQMLSFYISVKITDTFQIRTFHTWIIIFNNTCKMVVRTVVTWQLRDTVGKLVTYSSDMFLLCLWQQNWIFSWDVETSAKPDTTGRDAVFTFLSVKPLDSFKKTSDNFPAVLATTRLDILVGCQESCQARYHCLRWWSNMCKRETTGQFYERCLIIFQFC